MAAWYLLSFQTCECIHLIVLDIVINEKVSRHRSWNMVVKSTLYKNNLFQSKKNRDRKKNQANRVIPSRMHDKVLTKKNHVDFNLMPSVNIWNDFAKNQYEIFVVKWKPAVARVHGVMANHGYWRQTAVNSSNIRYITEKIPAEIYSTPQSKIHNLGHGALYSYLSADGATRSINSRLPNQIYKKKTHIGLFYVFILTVRHHKSNNKTDSFMDNGVLNNLYIRSIFD